MAKLIPSLAVLVAATVALPSGGWAQSSGLSMGDKAKKFTLPVSEGGEVKMKISGDEATKLSVNRTEIINMKIELLNKGIPETIISSPRAYFWTSDQRLQTRNGVKIDRGDMLITAGAMEWHLKGDRGNLRQGVTVKLTGFDVGNRDSMTKASNDLGGAIPVPEDEKEKPEEKEPETTVAEEKPDAAPSLFDDPTTASQSEPMPGLDTPAMLPAELPPATEEPAPSEEKSSIQEDIESIFQ